ncbi:MAG: hypothetical protein N3A53_07110 [Verrucomicrobiae bacterium]|nr:hypothetical protein [Verrucomicrobiae bacterium]
MRLVHILGMVLTQLSVGSLVMVALLSPREIRTSFFTFNSLVAACLLYTSDAADERSW